MARSQPKQQSGNRNGSGLNRGLGWLVFELFAVIVFEIGRGIGGAVKEIMLGRQP